MNIILQSWMGMVVFIILASIVFYKNKYIISIIKKVIKLSIIILLLKITYLYSFTDDFMGPNSFIIQLFFLTALLGIILFAIKVIDKIDK